MHHSQASTTAPIPLPLPLPIHSRPHHSIPHHQLRNRRRTSTKSALTVLLKHTHTSSPPLNVPPQFTGPPPAHAHTDKNYWLEARVLTLRSANKAPIQQNPGPSSRSLKVPSFVGCSIVDRGRFVTGLGLTCNKSASKLPPRTSNREPQPSNVSSPQPNSSHSTTTQHNFPHPASTLPASLLCCTFLACFSLAERRVLSLRTGQSNPATSSLPLQPFLQPDKRSPA